MHGKTAQGIAGIVLAAGRSTRMGTLKQLLPLGGKPTIEVVVEQVCGRLERVIAVLGHRAEEVAGALAGQPVVCAFNPDYGLGMLTSVQCGIRAAGGASGYLICLGDQPHLGSTADALLEAARQAGEGILIPTFQGRRGHPILIRSSYAGEILSLSPERGLNTVTRGHPQDTLEVPVEGREALEDMDTPADYQREARRYSVRGEVDG